MTLVAFLAMFGLLTGATTGAPDAAPPTPASASGLLEWPLDLLCLPLLCNDGQAGGPPPEPDPPPEPTEPTEEPTEPTEPTEEPTEIGRAHV